MTSKGDNSKYKMISKNDHPVPFPLQLNQSYFGSTKMSFACNNNIFLLNIVNKVCMIRKTTFPAFMPTFSRTMIELKNVATHQKWSKDQNKWTQND